jgi:hypothetical protein
MWYFWAGMDGHFSVFVFRSLAVLKKTMFKEMDNNWWRPSQKSPSLPMFLSLTMIFQINRDIFGSSLNWRDFHTIDLKTLQFCWVNVRITVILIHGIRVRIAKWGVIYGDAINPLSKKSGMGAKIKCMTRTRNLCIKHPFFIGIYSSGIVSKIFKLLEIIFRVEG